MKINFKTYLVAFLMDIAYFLPNDWVWGKNFKETKRLLKKNEHMSQEESDEFQYIKLKELLIYAYEHTKYYRALFDSVGFSPYDFSSVDQLECVPFLTKNIVREHFDEMVSDEFSADLKYASTSGSTGEPAKFAYCFNETTAKEQAFVINAWEKTGYNGKGRVAVLRGEKFDIDEEKHRYWKKNTPFYEDIYSSYHIGHETVKYYYDHMVKKKTKWIRAFPSAIAQFSNIALSLQLKPMETVKGVMVSSEVVHEYQIIEIKNFFPNAKINLIYGHTERACFATSCDCSLNYHFQPEYGYTEFVQNHEDEFEIVATGFNNHVMPLIRYRTGDVITRDNVCGCNCGFPGKIVKTIGGRSQSYIVTKKGYKIVETAFIAAVHSSSFDKVEKMQFEQYVQGKCLMRVKPITHLSDSDISDLKEVVSERLNNDIDIQIEIVDDIQPLRNGKNRLIIQHI